MSVTINSTLKNRLPRIPAEAITSKIMGNSYSLSLVFVGKQRAQRLNKTCRNQDYVPNVLSFPLSDQSGEVFICPAVAKKEASTFKLSYQGYLTFLLIHGLLHLKGYDHGATMERLEQKYIQDFSVT